MKRHIRQLQKLGACPSGIEWAEQFDMAQEAWNACERPQDMLWLLACRTGGPDSQSRKTMVLLLCKCVRPSLKFVPESEHRPRRAILAAERWARGTHGVTLADVRAAADEAYLAAYAADEAGAAYAAYAAYAADAAGAAGAIGAADAAGEADEAYAAGAAGAAYAADAAYAVGAAYEAYAADAVDAAYAARAADEAYAARAAYAAYAVDAVDAARARMCRLIRRHIPAAPTKNNWWKAVQA